MGHLFT